MLCRGRGGRCRREEGGRSIAQGWGGAAGVGGAGQGDSSRSLLQREGWQQTQPGSLSYHVCLLCDGDSNPPTGGDSGRSLRAEVRD